MIPVQMKNGEFDKLIQEALHNSEALKIKIDLAEKTIRKLEKRMLLKELLMEVVYKMGLILLSLAVLAGVLVWSNGNRLFHDWYYWVADKWQLIASVLLLIMITVLIDQVGLKYFQTTRKQVGI